MRKLSSRPRERGLALVIVLWVVVSAALLVSAFVASVRSGTVQLSNDVTESRIGALLDAGLEIAAARLIDTDDQRRWSPNGQAHNIAFANAKLTIILRDPNGLIDLNKTDAEVLLNFFRDFTGSEIAAQHFHDMIMKIRGENAENKLRGQEAEEDDDPKQGIGGGIELRSAKKKTAAIGTSRVRMKEKGSEEAKRDTKSDELDRPVFLDATQLRQLDGMYLDLYQQIIPFLTVYNRDGRINAMTASKTVLLSVPKLSNIDVERSLQIRQSDPASKDSVKRLLKRGAAYLSVESGPAYIVSVYAGTEGRKSRTGRQYVIITGLDGKAPYRLLSVKALRPLPSS